MTAHPADVVIVDGVDVSKGNLRTFEKQYMRLRMANAAEVASTKLTGQYGGIYVRSLQAGFDLDTADTTTADDGATCLVDFDGNRFKKITSGNVLTFSTTTSDADPGQGKFRADNATFLSVTKLWIDNLDTLGADLTAWLDTFDNYGASSNRGLLRITSLSAPLTQYAEFQVTGSVTNKSGYRELTVSPIVQLGVWPFTNNQNVAVAFTAAGVTGAAGISAPAIGFTFSTTTTDSDPGAGNLRFNNATPASVTFIYVDNTEVGGSSVTGWLDSFDDADNANSRGFLYLNKVTDPTKFFTFKVTGAVVDGTGYRKIPVSYLSGPTLFGNGVAIQMMFAPAADAITSGVRWTYETTTSMANPTAGCLRFDNATPTSAANIAVSSQTADSGNPVIRGYVLTWDDSGTPAYRGNLIIRKAGHPEVFITFKVLGITDNTQWIQIALGAAGAAAGSFTAGDRLDVEFVPTGAQGSDMVLLTSGTIANSATSLDIVLTVYTAYRKIIIDLQSLIPATDGVSLLARLSTDGGSTYDAAAASYQWGAQASDSNASAFALSSNNSDTSMNLTGTSAIALVGNGASEGIDLRVTIYDQTNSAKQTRVRSEGIASSSAATPALSIFQAGGQRKTAQDTDAIRFLWSSGNFAASTPGKYAVYGMN